MKTKRIIGRSDKVDLPDLGIEKVKAKVDTGAYTSSIHCKQIEVHEGVLSFWVSLTVGENKIVRKFQTKEFYQKAVKSSNGESQLRYIVKTKIVIFGKSYNTEFSLSDRSKMKNPILIGRKFLKNRFIVDVSLKNLSIERKTDSNK